MWKEVIFLLAWLNINFVMALVEEKSPSMDSKPWSMYNVHRHYSPPPTSCSQNVTFLRFMSQNLTLNEPASPRACHGPGEVKLDLSFSPITRAGEVLIQWSRYMKGATRLRTRHSPALSTTQDQKPNCIMTGGTPDYGPRPGGTPPALGWSVIAVKSSERGGSAGGTTAGLLTKIRQNVIFLRLCQKFKKTLKMFLQE